MDYSGLEHSLERVALQFENYQELDDRRELRELDREAVAESVIQRFETCYDTLWKHLRRHLAEVLGLPEVPASPKPVFRLAHENGVLPNGIEAWLQYADARVGTAHDYSGDKAQKALRLMPGFIADATALYRTLTGKPWA